MGEIDSNKIISLNDGKDYLVYRKGGGNTIEIFDIAVTSERRKGIGRKLIEILLSKLDESVYQIHAITRETNTVAISFYKALGFTPAAFIPDYYLEGHGIMFVKFLTIKSNYRFVIR